jgi:hypothetical protein
MGGGNSSQSCRRGSEGLASLDALLKEILCRQHALVEHADDLDLLSSSLEKHHMAALLDASQTRP